MAQQPFKLKVIGIPHIPAVTQINVRPDAGTNQDLIFKVDVGVSDIPIIDVKEDVEGKNLDGKVYQWFRAQFPQGEGWVRDDLVEIQGDGTTVGYPVLDTLTFAYSLTRQTGTVPQGAETQPTTAPTASSEVSSTPTASSEVSSAPTASSEISSTLTASSEVPSAPTASSEISSAPSVDSEVSSAPTAPGEILSDPTVSSEVSSPPSVASEVASTPTTVSEPAMAQAMSSFPAKLRPGPGTGYNPPVTSMQYGQRAEVLDSAIGDDGKPLYWLKVRYNGQEGWTREDLVRLSGGFTAFGLNAPDKYPCPAPESTWIRGWDTDGSIWNTGKHDGWDHSGSKGKPLYAGPNGGVVFQKALCSKCGSSGLSTVERGLQLYDSSVYSDPGWNFGYGHYIIVGYENSKLPASTQQYLQSIGRGGQHIFVMYAHCQDLLVEAEQTLEPGQQIATLGNSGNSSGAHLHLEVRISDTMSPLRWASLNDGLRSPGILFLR